MTKHGRPRTYTTTLEFHRDICGPMQSYAVWDAQGVLYHPLVATVRRLFGRVLCRKGKTAVVEVTITLRVLEIK